MARRLRAAAGTLLIVACALAALPATAQDPRAGAAQSVARAWLVQVDKGDADASWNSAGAKFRDAYPLDQWREALKTYRAPLGALDSRTAISTTFNKEVPDLPPGDYANVQFRTNFANKIDAHEAVSLELAADGTWLVIGYALR